MQAVKETYNARYDGDTQPDDAKVKRRLDDALRKGRIKRNYWKDGWFGALSVADRQASGSLHWVKIANGD